MKIILESFTVYCDVNTKKNNLSKYESVYKIEEVLNYKGAFDFIPKKIIQDDEISKEEEKLKKDSKIKDYDKNLEEIETIDVDRAIEKSIFNTSCQSNLSYDWHLDIMNIYKAWEITKNGKKEKGEDIIIAHPDSGYMKHYELFNDKSRIIEEYDLIEEDNDAIYEKATHGLATASVILGNQEGRIKGVAPKAKLLPIRVAKVDGKIFPTPVLIGHGMRRLRKAIEYAEEKNADIISISLGGSNLFLGNKTFKKAIKRAKNNGIIIMAAAGNVVRLVVYPAKYDDVIAVAASNHKNKEWSKSCRGKEVDITAPGENIWKADIEHDICVSSGTSYAVANLAGVTALWLAHWGKEDLISIFGKDKLVDGFIRMMKSSVLEEDKLPKKGFGAGIINAEKLLKLNPKDYSLI